MKMTKLFFKDQQKIFNFYFIFKKNNAFFSITDNRGYVYKQINIGSVRYGDSSTELKFKNKRLKFIDLSADFRLTSPTIYEKNYKTKHKAKELIKKSVYSIPELLNHSLENFRIQQT